jgi:hypothetical protein
MTTTLSHIKRDLRFGRTNVAMSDRQPDVALAASAISSTHTSTAGATADLWFTGVPGAKHELALHDVGRTR